MRLLLFLIPIPALLVAASAPLGPDLQAVPAVVKSSAERTSDVDRSPNDVAITPDGRLAVVANRGSETVALVRLSDGVLLQELPTDGDPFAVAVSPDGSQAAVSLWRTDKIALFGIGESKLTLQSARVVGDEPRGVAFSSDGSRLFVALAGADSVVAMGTRAPNAGKRLAVWPVETEPWHLVLTPDGRRLAVGNSRARTVSVLSSTTGKSLHTVNVLGRNLRHMAVSPDGKWAYLPGIAERGSPATPENIDRGWVVGNRLIRVPLQAEGSREAITLDTGRNAVGDVDGVAMSPDGKSVALTCGGSHEILLMRFPMPFEDYGGPGDFIDPEFSGDTKRFRRIKLGGRPLGAQFTPDGKSVVVANYFQNSLQIVDFASGDVKSIPLGGASAPSLVRRGEIIFHDASRSFGQWYSCASCHTEGHTNGGRADTYNDGFYGQTKKTPSLRLVSNTAPYTWHGWQKSLTGAVRESMEKSMMPLQRPTEADVEAVTAYISTLRYPANPNRLADGSMTPLAKLGEAVFRAKACDTCHGGPEFSSPIAVKVGLESPQDIYPGFNPPTLIGVYGRAPYLHDGRASTLEDVLTTYHQPSKLTKKPDCSPAELRQLVAYLRSL